MFLTMQKSHFQEALSNAPYSKALKQLRVHTASKFLSKWNHYRISSYFDCTSYCFCFRAGISGCVPKCMGT